MKSSLSMKLVDAAVSLIVFCAGSMTVFALAGIGVTQASDPARQQILAQRAGAGACVQIGGHMSPVYRCPESAVMARAQQPAARYQVAVAGADAR